MAAKSWHHSRGNEMYHDTTDPFAAARAAEISGNTAFEIVLPDGTLETYRDLGGWTRTAHVTPHDALVGEGR